MMSSERKTNFIQGFMTRSSRNSGSMLPGPKECTSISPFIVFTRKFLKILVAENLLDLPINEVSVEVGPYETSFLSRVFLLSY